jgi:hypothetical protein
LAVAPAGALGAAYGLQTVFPTELTYVPFGQFNGCGGGGGTNACVGGGVACVGGGGGTVVGVVVATVVTTGAAVVVGSSVVLVAIEATVRSRVEAVTLALVPVLPQPASAARAKTASSARQFLCRPTIAARWPVPLASGDEDTQLSVTQATAPIVLSATDMHLIDGRYAGLDVPDAR